MKYSRILSILLVLVMLMSCVVACTDGVQEDTPNTDSPEEQEAERKRAEESNKKWKAYIAELKKKRSVIDHTA